METGTTKDVPTRAVTLLRLLGVLCLLILGCSAYLGSARLVSVGQFQLESRNDGHWRYQKTKAVTFSASGSSLRTGDVYCIGPFRATHWRDWIFIHPDWKGFYDKYGVQRASCYRKGDQK
jgi:hypothetical protein